MDANWEHWDWQFSLGITLLRSVQIVFASLVLFIPVSLLNSIPWYRYIRVCLSIHPLKPFKLFTNKNWYDHLYERLRRRQWHPTPVPLPGKSHGQRSLVGCSPWGCKKSDTTERLHFHFHFHALEKEMAIHSSVFAGRIPGTGEPGGLSSMGSHRVGHDWSDLAAAAAMWRLDSPFWTKSYAKVWDEAVNEIVLHFNSSIPTWFLLGSCKPS